MNILQNLAGLKDMTEQVIATDFLINTKAMVKDYSIALSETTTQEVRDVLRNHLESAINTHDKILRFMMANGYYHVHNSGEQIAVDIQTSNTALNLK